MLVVIVIVLVMILGVMLEFGGGCSGRVFFLWLFTIRSVWARTAIIIFGIEDYGVMVTGVVCMQHEWF